MAGSVPRSALGGPQPEHVPAETTTTTARRTGVSRGAHPEETKTIAYDGVHVRAVSESTDKPAFRAVMDKAIRHHIPKDRALEIAIEEARKHEQFEFQAAVRADGGNSAQLLPERIGGLSRTQLMLLGAGVIGLAWALSA